MAKGASAAKPKRRSRQGSRSSKCSKGCPNGIDRAIGNVLPQDQHCDHEHRQKRRQRTQPIGEQVRRTDDLGELPSGDGPKKQAGYCYVHEKGGHRLDAILGDDSKAHTAPKPRPMIR